MKQSETSQDITRTDIEVSLFLSAETSSGLGAPAWIKSIPEGLLLYDNGYQKFSTFDPDGNRLLTFGGVGQGPGEFQEISGSGYWRIDDVYLIFDRPGAKLITYSETGEWIEDIPVDHEGMPYLNPSAIEAITPGRFIIPSNGEEESLLSVVDLDNHDTLYFGKPVDENSAAAGNMEERIGLALDRIPSRLRSNVLIGRNSSGIFSFQQTTGILEKYTFAGELIWDRLLDFPEQKGLFEHMYRENRSRENQGQPSQYSFNLGRDMYVDEEGTAILLNVLEDEPVPVVWIPDNGENIRRAIFHGMKNKQPFEHPRFFTLSDDRTHIYFGNIFDGIIYQAEWPFKSPDR